MSSLTNTHGKVSLALAALGFAIVLFASTYNLSESPGIWYDEGMFTQVALNLANHGMSSIQTAPGEFISAGFVSGGFPFIGPVALSYKLFGPGVLQGRAVMAFFIIAFVVTAYALIRTFFGAWIGAWSLLLLASFAMLYGIGKSVLGEVPGLFFLMLGALALVWLERSSYKNLWAYVLTGLAIGLFVATKPNFVLVLPALALVWLIRWREVRFRLQGFIFGALAFLLPVGIWFYLQFNGIDSLAYFVSFYSNPYGETDLTALAIQNALRLVNETTPLYTLLLLVFWGVAIFIRRISAEKVSITELVLFFFSLAVIVGFLRLVGWYRYLFPAATMALLFLPYAVITIFKIVSTWFPRLARASWLPYAFLMLMFVGQSYQLARSSYVADYYHSDRSRDVGNMLAALPADANIFVYDVPEVVIMLSKHEYYQFMAPHPDQLLGAETLPILARGGTDYVIIGTRDYNSKDPQFVHYRLADTANRYTLLKRI